MTIAKPATPATRQEFFDTEMDGSITFKRELVRRYNAYPSLVAQNKRLKEALRRLMLRCDGAEGVRADGSNIQTMEASALLAELGE